MRIDELVQGEWHEQERIIRRGLPAKALKECAELIEVSPSKLARILGITRKPKRRYSTWAGEKIWRVANLSREVSMPRTESHPSRIIRFTRRLPVPARKRTCSCKHTTGD